MTTSADLSRKSSEKARSLRSRWHRAFALLTVVVVVGSAASITGVFLIINSYRGSVLTIQNDLTTSAQLRTEIVATAILVASATTTAQQLQQEADFKEILAGYATEAASTQTPAAKALLAQSLAKWRTLADSAGTPGHPVSARDLAFTVETLTPSTLNLLDQTNALNGKAVARSLAAQSHRDQKAFLALSILDLLAIVVVVRLARHLTSEVLRPISVLRDSANRLAGGEFDHHVVVDRFDELGELAVAFNAMADAISGSQRSLIEEANTDSLSGLANRAAFYAQVQATLAQPDRRPGDQALMFVDLDDFKDVNDTLGHAAGDEVLRVVAVRLRDTVRPTDLVARLGGDEFALLLDTVPDIAHASSLAERVVRALAQPVDIGTRRVRVGASVGLAMRAANTSQQGWVREADVAMYAAKAKGKSRVERYDAGLDDAAVARQLLKDEVAVAAELGQLVLEYQPIVDLDTGALVGLEALVRWQHPTQGLLPPSAFIALAEESGAIFSIGAWVLDTAARQLRLWQRRYAKPDLWVSVNVSVRQLDAPDCASEMLATLVAAGLDPATVVIEVTESVLADPKGGAAAALTELRMTGIRVALDDFGTGYSSIGYLRQLPVDSLKIDRSFVAGSYPDAPGNALLEAVVGMAQRLGLEIIPEGIEQPAELEHLRAIGCHLGQGFLMSRPRPPEIIETLLGDANPFPHLNLTASALPAATFSGG
jgi:diguanylate cyclase (GGDEF)-like protein